MFAPDDFRNDPYTAGLNQMGHIMFGAAITVICGWIVAGLAFVAWEAFQLRYMAARKHDYYQDCGFWTAGVLLAGSHWLPVAAVSLGGMWMGVVWLLQK